jgi:hypothetical protein
VRLFALLFAVAACTTEHDPDLTPPLDPPSVPDEHPVALQGPLAVHDHLVLALDDLVADPQALTQYLHDYANAPGATMLAAADAAHVPALATLRAQLSPGLQTSLPGWFDESVTALSRLGVAGLETGVAHALKKFDLVGELRVDGGDADNPHVQHAVTSIDFTPMGYPQTFDLVAGDDETLTAETDGSFSGSSLSMSEHTLVVDAGGYAWDAVDAQIADRGGIRGMLSDLTMCNLVALSVATKCNGNECVGHADLIQAICEGAVNEIADGGREQAAALKLKLVLAGTVGVDDQNRDQIGDGLFAGTWNATVSVGENAPAPMTFRFDSNVGD